MKFSLFRRHPVPVAVICGLVVGTAAASGLSGVGPEAAVIGPLVFGSATGIVVLGELRAEAHRHWGEDWALYREDAFRHLDAATEHAGLVPTATARSNVYTAAAALRSCVDLVDSDVSFSDQQRAETGMELVDRCGDLEAFAAELTKDVDEQQGSMLSQFCAQAKELQSMADDSVMFTQGAALMDRLPRTSEA